MLHRRQESFEIEAWKLQRTGTLYTPLLIYFGVKSGAGNNTLSKWRMQVCRESKIFLSYFSFFTLPIAGILSVKNVRAWVLMVFT